MGLNSTTFVPAYTSGEVLTAADLTVTNSGVPVFADTTARDAAFGGTGEKVLAEGQLAYLEDSDVVQYYDGSVWATVGPSADSGLTLISATTIGTAVATVTVSSAFSATYDNYKILVSGGTGTEANLTLIFGSTTTGYYQSFARLDYSTSSFTVATANNGASFTRAGYANTNGINLNIDVLSPNLAKNTFIDGWVCQNNTGAGAGSISGFLNDTTQYTAFTIGATSLTGGTVRVYGYQNS